MSLMPSGEPTTTSVPLGVCTSVSVYEFRFSLSVISLLFSPRISICELDGFWLSIIVVCALTINIVAMVATINNTNFFIKNLFIKYKIAKLILNVKIEIIFFANFYF